MRRVTGTHVYTYSKCAQAVALDFHGDRALRRPATEVEELVLRRGRELEDRLTAELGYSVPEYPERDFDSGAAATLALLRSGVPGVLQGVLLGDERLGIPDLLRREEGASELGEHHYVVGDVKSSGAARGDQILQVMFYSGLLRGLQGRSPAYAYLVLRDGREERFAVSDYAAVAAEVEDRVAALRDPGARPRPFLSAPCGTCRWSPLCLPELEGCDDLSLLQGMTRGLRQTLEAAGITDGEAARAMPIEAVARRTRLEAALLRRLKKAAQARAAARPIPERRAKRPASTEKAVAHLLTDAYAERVHYFGILFPAREDGNYLEAFPASREEEVAAFASLIERLPAGTPVWHYGETLPRWYEDAAWRRRVIDLESRFVNLARRLRGAAVFPGPVFGLDGHVRLGLEIDPHRAGDAGAVALWVAAGRAEQRLRAKGRSDLMDLAALIGQLVEGGGDGSDA